jgi:hypothetical protein
MTNRQVSGQGPVAQTADRILIAWKEGHDRDLKEALGRASLITTQPLDAFETEKLEVLESVVQSLQAWRFPSMSTVRAGDDELRVAVRLLEHLADRSARSTATVR